MAGRLLPCMVLVATAHRVVPPTPPATLNQNPPVTATLSRLEDTAQPTISHPRQHNRQLTALVQLMLPRVPQAMVLPMLPRMPLAMVQPQHRLMVVRTPPTDTHSLQGMMHLTRLRRHL